MRKHLAILALIFCSSFVTACTPATGEDPVSQTSLTTGSSGIPDSYFENLSYPSSEPTEIASAPVSSFVYSHPDQTGDTVKLELDAEEIVKVEYLGIPQQHIPATQTEDPKQIRAVVDKLNALTITDDNDKDYSKMGGRGDRIVLHVNSGKTVEIWYTGGGIRIKDDDFRYGNRYLSVKGDNPDEISNLLESLH